VSRRDVSEAVVLSTCNRTEVYAVAERFHGAYQDIRDFLAEVAFLAPEDFSDHLYVHYDAPAVAHLFAVAAGLDSAVLGESEILGQVKDAWDTAVHEGASNQLLSRLFKHAVESGKRVRTETGIGRHPVSISSAAVAVAAEHLGSLDGARVLVIGAGEMGEGVARSLVSRGIADVCVANRTAARAAEIAKRIGGRAVSLDQLEEQLIDADVLVASTASQHVLVERSAVEHVMAQRPDRPLLVVDVALPRDVDPGVREVDGVTLLDLDDLKDFARRSAERRRAEIGKAREIINADIDRYQADRAAREVAPIVTALRATAEQIRRAELDRAAAKLGPFDAAARAEVTRLLDGVTRGLVNKLLHEPTVRIKAAAGTDVGDTYVETLAALFDLDASVASADPLDDPPEPADPAE
jgi:glutamyl-tRNA reductase